MGQVLGRTGGAAYFADLAMSAMGHFRGGAAKIAVVGSALFGMISGAAVSNVMAVGIVTIPLMSRSGFSPDSRGRDRIGRLDRRPVDAAGDGRRRLHHGGVPAGAPTARSASPRSSRRSSITLRCSSTSISKPPSTRSARRRSKNIAGVPRGAEVRLALPDPDRLPDRHADLSGSISRSRSSAPPSFHRHPDRAEPDLRLSRHAASPRARCCARSSTPAAPRSTSS